MSDPSGAQQISAPPNAWMQVAPGVKVWHATAATFQVDVQPTAPEIRLDPDGQPIVVFDLQGDPRDLSVWGAVLAGPAVALIATDSGEPPTSGEAMALADALNPDRVGLLVEAREQAGALRTELARQADRVLQLAGELNQDRAECEAVCAELAEIRGQLDAIIDAAGGGAPYPRSPIGDAVHNMHGRAEAAELSLQHAREDIERYRRAHAAQAETIRQQQQELDEARSVGRDVARLAVIALSRSPKAVRVLRGKLRRTP